MRLSNEHYKAWVEQLNRDIDALNYFAYDPIFGGDKFSIGFRGKYHKVVLCKNGNTIACGIKAITEAIIKYKKKYAI